MPQVRLDDMKLIELVEQNRLLYDKNDSEYHDREKKTITWKAISAALEAPVADCRKRFRCLRDRYNKEKKLRQDKMLDDRSLPDVFKRMKFLWEHLSHKGSGGSSSEPESPEEASSPEMNENEELEETEPMAHAETELVTEENNVLQQEIIIIYDETGSVEGVYSHHGDTQTVGELYFEEAMDSPMLLTEHSIKNPNEKADASPTEILPDTEMDSRANLSNEHPNENDAESERKILDAEMNSHLNLPNEHSNENDEAESEKRILDMEMNSHLNLSSEHPNAKDGAQGTEEIPGEISALEREESGDTRDAPETAQLLPKPGEEKNSTPSNSEAQIAPQLSSLPQKPVFHTYNKKSYKSDTPQFKRRRNRNKAFYHRPENIIQAPLLPMPKAVSTTKACNVAFCAMIKQYLDKISRPDRLSAARLQILSLLHNELYSGYR